MHNVYKVKQSKAVDRPGKWATGGSERQTQTTEEKRIEIEM